MRCACVAQGRKPDKGPPWLLRQVLQPELLVLLDDADTSEMLHGVYIHLAGRGDPRDLSVRLGDVRTGLRHAAGFRSTAQSLHDSGGNASSSSSGSGGGDAAADPLTGSSRAFHLPLHKLAAFLRAAKLLPRLLDKYITQQQLRGHEQAGRPGGSGGTAGSIMPALHARTALAHAHGFSVAGKGGQRRR